MNSLKEILIFLNPAYIFIVLFKQTSNLLQNKCLEVLLILSCPYLFRVEWVITVFVFGLMYVGQLYGLEKFWAFLKYSQMKNQTIDPKLQEYLKKFRSIDDFRVDVSVGCF